MCARAPALAYNVLELELRLPMCALGVLSHIPDLTFTPSVAQAGLELVVLAASASQVAGITSVHHQSQL